MHMQNQLTTVAGNDAESVSSAREKEEQKGDFLARHLDLVEFDEYTTIVTAIDGAEPVVTVRGEEEDYATFKGRHKNAVDQAI